MRVRDHAFPLLLQKNAGEFPIVYVARIGKSHRGETPFTWPFFLLDG